MHVCTAVAAPGKPGDQKMGFGYGLCFGPERPPRALNHAAKTFAFAVGSGRQGTSEKPASPAVRRATRVRAEKNRRSEGTPWRTQLVRDEDESTNLPWP